MITNSNNILIKQSKKLEIMTILPFFLYKILQILLIQQIKLLFYWLIEIKNFAQYTKFRTKMLVIIMELQVYFVLINYRR